MTEEWKMVLMERQNRAARRAAFTLVEVLIVVAIVVVMAGVGGLTLMKYLEESRENAARAQVKTLETAVKAYQIKHGEPPASLVILTQVEADGSAPALESAEALLDPWNSPYQYDPNGSRNNGIKPDIWAVSPKGVTIGNWSIRQ